MFWMFLSYTIKLLLKPNFHLDVRFFSPSGSRESSDSQWTKGKG